MHTSLVRQAFDAYTSGNFTMALKLYRELAATVGQDFFSLNIALCLKQIRRHRLAMGSAPLPLRRIKVACIMDDFTFAAYGPECVLLPLTPQNFPNELEEFAPDMLFVESAWNGKEGLWNRKISHAASELKEIIAWCRAHGVPTAFWNKEDPVHYNTFLSSAQLFDYVFTTDIDCIARYKAALKHSRIYLLPFACQPALHNPMECHLRKDAFCFAGAYYVRYPERTKDLENYAETLPAYKPLDIFDRNYGKADVNYQFPTPFHPFIVGTLPYGEIDKAYKGYAYAINLNSIKNSQSMFARRVFELLASNTITVSNYSRGMRLFFGDLVPASDSGQELICKLRKLDAVAAAKLRLAGVRKILLEHTYEHRLRYIASILLGHEGHIQLPETVCAALAQSTDDARRILDNYQRQSHKEKRLILVLDEGVAAPDLEAESASAIISMPLSRAAELSPASAVGKGSWLAFLSPKDYYGPNYLLDLVLATKYSDCAAIGKGAYHQWIEQGVQPVQMDAAYKETVNLPYRRCIMSSAALPEDMSLGSLLAKADKMEAPGPCLAVDPFNYCLNGRESAALTGGMTEVDDPPLDVGISLDELLRLAETIPPSTDDDSAAPHWDVDKLARLFQSHKHEHIQFTPQPDGLRIHSTLADGVHEYVYGAIDMPISSLPFGKTMKCWLESSPGLSIQYVFVFLNSDRQKISHVIFDPNKNQVAPMPENTMFIRFGIRIYGSGTCIIPIVLWAHRKFVPNLMLHRGSTLLVTNNYPEYGNLYRNAFVHSRVKAYQQSGCNMDVFRFWPNAAMGHHEFEGVDVITGNAHILRKLLATGSCRTVLVHFLTPEMWDVLKDFPECAIVVWVHGAEIQPWTRREFNLRTERERAKARMESGARTAFWRGLLADPPANLHLVFVSRYFAEEVMEDLGFRLSETLYSVIHNPIDTDRFAYSPKNAEQRKKILSIHPYSSAKYGNDLSVEAIQMLANEPFFQDLEFRMIGDGPLFDTLLEPLKNLPNVLCEKRFLTQHDISLLHREYGVFLSPTRWDSQGVSRNEAMSSGLVPVTNAVAAIPEFMDASCAMLAPEEDARAMAEAIRTLYEQPQLFMDLSRAAAARVYAQAAAREIIALELDLFVSASGANAQTVPRTVLPDAPGMKTALSTHLPDPPTDAEPIPAAGIMVSESKTAPAKEAPAKISAFLSFDVEALPGRADDDHVERLIWGKIGGQEYGIGKLCAILKEYGLKANFMIDMGACALYGDRPVERAGKFLRDQGHEIHAHLHPEWLPRQWKIPLPEGYAARMDLLDYRMSELFLAHAGFKFKQLYGHAPYAFRSGAFLFNEHIVEAAAKAGFTCLTNFNSTRHRDQIRIAAGRTDNGPFFWDNGILEIPVDMSPEPLSCDFAKYIGMFDRVPRKTNKTFNITLHSWSLLKRVDGLHKYFAPEYEEKLRAICEHLAENTEVKGYSEYQPAVSMGEPPELVTPELTEISLEGVVVCPICKAVFSRTQSGNRCVGCESGPRHRQIHDVLQRCANPFSSKNVLACYANLLEIAFILDGAHKLVNFDIRPVHEADMQMDIQDMSAIQDASFDAFMAVHVLNHVKDDLRAVREIHRILVPGGVALITIPYHEDEPTTACTDLSRHYGEKNLRAYGIGTYRMYGFNDAVELFSRFFSVRTEEGFDSISNETMKIFLLTKKEGDGNDNTIRR